MIWGAQNIPEAALVMVHHNSVYPNNHFPSIFESTKRLLFEEKVGGRRAFEMPLKSFVSQRKIPSIS